MFFPWYASVLLVIESNDVIGLRLVKLANGGGDARDEAHRMVAEKLNAAFEAGVTLMFGGTLDRIVERYREQVAANSSRLHPI
jgi:hypothetical protein